LSHIEIYIDTLLVIDVLIYINVKLAKVCHDKREAFFVENFRFENYVLISETV